MKKWKLVRPGVRGNLLFLVLKIGAIGENKTGRKLIDVKTSQTFFDVSGEIVGAADLLEGLDLAGIDKGDDNLRGVNF